MKILSPTFYITNCSTAVLAAICCIILPGPAAAQYDSYDQTLSLIKTYENQKKYTVSDSGPLLDEILADLVNNEGGYLNEGLKRLLTGYSTAAKITKQAAAAESPADGNLLELLFYTRQNPVPVFITDDDLAGRAAYHGAAIKQAEFLFWKRPNINLTNVIRALEAYPPSTAATLVDVVADTWYQGGTVAYDKLDTSWASQSLWQVYHDVREVEFARHSIVVRLLNDEGYISLPTDTSAYFTWSGRNSIDIPLDAMALWDGDVPELQRLLSNPYYGAAAQGALHRLGY